MKGGVEEATCGTPGTLAAAVTPLRLAGLCSGATRTARRCLLHLRRDPDAAV